MEIDAVKQQLINRVHCHAKPSIIIIIIFIIFIMSSFRSSGRLQVIVTVKSINTLYVHYTHTNDEILCVNVSKPGLLLLHPFNGFFQDSLGKPTPER